MKIIYLDLCGFFGETNVFCPLSKEKVFNKKKQKHKYIDVPSFGGYIFLKTEDMDKAIKFISSRYSRYYFVTIPSCSAQYASVSDSEIHKMKQADASAIHTTFYVDERVVIIAGAFRNFMGTIKEVKDKRVKISVEVFGKDTIVELDADQISVP